MLAMGPKLFFNYSGRFHFFLCLNKLLEANVGIILNQISQIIGQLNINQKKLNKKK